MASLYLSPSLSGDDTANLQNALASMQPGSILQLSPGATYTFSAPLVRLGVGFRLAADGAVLVYAGPDSQTALTLGNPAGSKTADAFGPRLVVSGLTIKTRLPRAGNSATALCLQNAYCGTVERLGVAGFGTGFQLVGDGTGCTYGNYHFSQMIDNATQLHILARNGGFVTESDFRGPGHFSYNGIFADKVCAHLTAETDGSANAVVGGMRFWGMAFEGQSALCAFANLGAGCRHIRYLECRGETAPGQKMPLNVAAGVSGCRVDGSTTWMVAPNDPNPITFNCWTPTP